MTSLFIKLAFEVSRNRELKAEWTSRHCWEAFWILNLRNFGKIGLVTLIDLILILYRPLFGLENGLIASLSNYVSGTDFRASSVRDSHWVVSRNGGELICFWLYSLTVVSARSCSMKKGGLHGENIIWNRSVRVPCFRFWSMYWLHSRFPETSADLHIVVSKIQIKLGFFPN